MATTYQLAFGASAFALLAIGLAEIADAPDAPQRVYVPSEEVTGRAAGHDVVHALQDIVESGPVVSPSVFATARPVAADTYSASDTQALIVEAEQLFLGLESSALSELERLTLRRSWEMAETSEARADVVLRLRAASASE